MRRIMLKVITLKNFKGVKNLTVKFEPNTFIYGDNGTGKTTIFDAFTWLLFDKDSRDRKSFEIKTLNSHNETIPGLEHEVTGVLMVEGKEITLRKIHREKWAKKRGEAAKVFTGNETLYYIDEIPVKQGEYTSRVNSIIEENIFKLITNPLYFSTSLKWMQRRDVILQIIGDVGSEEIFSYKENLKALERLLVDKDIDTLKKSLAVRKKRLNEDLKAIPYRIDEINNSLQDIDYEAVEQALEGYIGELNILEEKLMESCRTKEALVKDQQELYALKGKISALEFEAKKEALMPLAKLYEDLSRCQREAAALENKLTKLDCEVYKGEDEHSELQKSIRALEENWMKAAEEVLIIPEDCFICPTCRRSFEAEDIEAKRLHLYQDFNIRKNKTLVILEGDLKAKKERSTKLEAQVNSLKTQQKHMRDKLYELQQSKDKLQHSIDNFTGEAQAIETEEYKQMKEELAVLSSKVEQYSKEKLDLDSLQKEKANINSCIRECRKNLEVKEQNERLKGRIAELLAQEKLLASQIAELEGQELLCEDYIKTKVEMLEKKINEKFKFVKFKLFNVLMNGSLEECCEALIDGVPFGNTNTAGQINGGLDIINALSQHYGVYAPVFIDNRESINKIIDCSSQLINLVVSRDPELMVRIS